MSDHPESVSRREFAKRAAVATAAALPAVAAQVPPTAAAAEASKAAELRPQHELLVDLLRQRFPHEKLTPEIIELLRADVAGDLGRGVAVNNFPLKNSDEPGFVFAAWRSS